VHWYEATSILHANSTKHEHAGDGQSIPMSGISAGRQERLRLGKRNRILVWTICLGESLIPHEFCHKVEQDEIS
jgi:hypothetical protein